MDVYHLEELDLHESGFGIRFCQLTQATQWERRIDVAKKKELTGSFFCAFILKADQVLREMPAAPE